jgi:hypothetical protein
MSLYALFFAQALTAITAFAVLNYTALAASQILQQLVTSMDQLSPHVGMCTMLCTHHFASLQTAPTMGHPTQL